MTCRCFLLFALFIAVPVLSQEYDWQPLTREIVISGSDSSIRANILIKQEDQEINDEYMYYWHNKGRINCNMGGHAGELLHGEYLVFDANKRMITLGQFENGLMVGTWKRWYSTGQIKSIAEYQNGQLYGLLKLYDAEGNLIKITEYEEGKIFVKQDKSFSIFKSGDKAESDSIPQVE